MYITTSHGYMLLYLINLLIFLYALLNNLLHQIFISIQLNINTK